MAVTVSQIQTTFSEFADADDAVVQLALDQALRLVNKTQWGTTRFDDGVLYLSAHILKILLEGDELAPSAVTSERVAKVAVSFQAIDAAKNSFMAGTTYGRWFMHLESLVFPERKT